MSTSPSNNNTSNTKMPRNWLSGFGIATVAVTMVLSALSNITPPGPRNSFYLFDRQLLFKGHPSGSEDTCAGGDECQRWCDLAPLCDTDACRVACPSPDDARECGCTPTADKCWNEGCEAQCGEDYICESESCQAACNEDEEKACGCTEPQPPCFQTSCEVKCQEDPRCGDDEDGTFCERTCLSAPQALACGCGVVGECFNSKCRDQCTSDSICATQGCQDTCVTAANTIACGCGCIKSECGRQCIKDNFCITSECQEACGESLGLEEACGCALRKDRPNRPTVAPTEGPMVSLTPFSFKADLKLQVDRYVDNQVAWSKSDCNGKRCDLYYGYGKLLS
jgi:hypothetical protein